MFKYIGTKDLRRFHKKQLDYSGKKIEYGPSVHKDHPRVVALPDSIFVFCLNVVMTAAKILPLALCHYYNKDTPTFSMS